MDFRDHVGTAEERYDIPGKVDPAVLGQVQDVPFLQFQVVLQVAGLQHIVQVDLDGLVGVVLMDQEHLLLGRIPGEASGGSQGVHDGMALGEFIGAGFLHFSEHMDPDTAQLDDVHGDVRFHIIPGKAVPEVLGELVHGHAAGLDFSHQGEGNGAVGPDGIGRLLGILEIGADFLLLDDDDVQLVAGAQGVFLGCCRQGKGSQGKGHGQDFLFHGTSFGAMDSIQKISVNDIFLLKKTIPF